MGENPPREQKRKKENLFLKKREQKRKKENPPKEQNEKQEGGMGDLPPKHIKNVLSFSLKNTK